ncbi:WecB/TagA/CpsF family glycosyltransferase [Catellatospora sichuanensis]|uniref:WecB/TagA/CpsF family glycosyltransferase n=1 Tax=Catellatospora sichuanensis TaxID=1969805 RepID=UPI0011845297|nr:WecB/TagA/CpsF family glycosyltransferase [Catellatospora sichuanensis]
MNTWFGEADFLRMTMNDSVHRERVVLGGITVDLLSDDGLMTAVRDALESGDRGRTLAIASANIDHIHHFAGSGDLHGSTPDVDWLVLLDGVPLVRKASRLTGRDEAKLSGSDLLPRMVELAEQAGATLGFLGGTPAMHGRLGLALAERHPTLKVVGQWTPSREVVNDPVGSSALAGEIRQAGPEILVVGLGKPRQERWIARHGAATGARVVLAFGAAADFLAGTVDRAPDWVVAMGAEWAFRLVREPRRLARRYLVQGPPAWWKLRTRSYLP